MLALRGRKMIRMIRIMWGKTTYWTSSEAGMSGVFSLGSI
jgi:hypothetical protein